MILDITPPQNKTTNLQNLLKKLMTLNHHHQHQHRKHLLVSQLVLAKNVNGISTALSAMWLNQVWENWTNTSAIHMTGYIAIIVGSLFRCLVLSPNICTPTVRSYFSATNVINNSHLNHNWPHTRFPMKRKDNLLVISVRKEWRTKVT